ncbi:MAG: cytochrome c biogenesis protein ResB [Gemmataceae bacterium]|nr:cytochrome c biogenesis protein ResB [Planctomycetia bacterium]MBX3399326.1 cytochrome c biogenesis protein ResB [Gemmataceae bacterium]
MDTDNVHPDATPPTDWRKVAHKVLKPLASLQLTVVLFALSMVLVFFGTVAMMSAGLWTVVDQYFRSAIVWIPFDLIRKFGTVFFDLPKDGSPWPFAFPFPGGWTIGAAMLANLVAAHLVRFKLTWKRSGVILLHAGVILLMIGELVTGLYAVESTMSLKIGEKSNFLDVTREFEIAIVDPSDKDHDTTTVVPMRFFQKPGTVQHESLPFDLEVVAYWPNTSSEEFLTRPEGEFVFGIPQGRWYRFAEKAEGAGVDTESRSDAPSVIVRALDKQTGKDLGKHFLSLWFYPNFERNKRFLAFAERTVTVGGKTYWLMLRHKRVFRDYTIELQKFEHGKYPGTEIARDFASTVIVRDQAGGDGREVRIWMNNPLRLGDDSLYQHQFFPGDTGTVLQVVENRGRLIPYISCILVTLGMLVHFGFRLSGFLNKPKAVAA